MPNLALNIVKNFTCNLRSSRSPTSLDAHHICNGHLQPFFLRSPKIFLVQRSSPMYKNPAENGSKLLSRSLVNYYLVSLKHPVLHLRTHRQLTIYFCLFFFHRSTMRATIFNVCAIVSLFSVAIHAAPGPPSVPYAPRSLPDCIKDPGLCKEIND